MGSYKQLLVLLLGIVEAYWSKLYEHKKERKDKRYKTNIFELNLEGTVTQNEKAQRKLKFTLKNES